MDFLGSNTPSSLKERHFSSAGLALNHSGPAQCQFVPRTFQSSSPLNTGSGRIKLRSIRTQNTASDHELGWPDLRLLMRETTARNHLSGSTAGGTRRPLAMGITKSTCILMNRAASLSLKPW